MKSPKSAALIALWTVLTISAAVGGTLFFTPKPPPAKATVTVDLQKLIRLKAEKLAKSESPTDAQYELSAYTDRLNERLKTIAKEANVLIFIKQGVVAGADRDITDLLMEVK